jgi:hypothetical protein
VSRIAFALALALAGCAAPPLELSVDVRTDLAPGTAFTSVRVELTPGQGDPVEPVTRGASAGDPFFEGERVADFRGVPRGPSQVRATLRDASGADILTRAVDLELDDDYALTIVLSAACASRVCPGVGDDPSQTECVSGHCVDTRCGGPTPEGCGAVACETQNDCVGQLGCPAACIEGSCVCVGVATDGGVDDVDAGECECAPGATEDETQPCGMCGEGTQTRPRTCGEDCHWMAGEWGTCATAATCTPGQTDSNTRACGNCDTGSQRRTRSCDDATCTWGGWSSWGSCSGGGTCSPGATRTGCDPCGVEVCSDSCHWGSCRPRSGTECLRIRPGTSGPEGTNRECCGAGKWHFCLSSCNWSATCETCSGCDC